MTDTDTDTAAEASTDLAETDDAARDEGLEAFWVDVADALGDFVVEHELLAGRGLWVRVRPEAWVDVIRTCRTTLELDFFDFLSGMDWRSSPWGRYEDTPFDGPDSGDSAAHAEQAGEPGDLADATGDDAEESTDEVTEPAGEGGVGYAGGDSHFQVMCRLYSTRRHQGVILKVDLDPEHPELPTVSAVYPGADWHEREANEMFGFNFVGHPHLLHLYLPSDFEGHPLRKDHPLLSRVVKPWPGVVDVEAIPPHLEAELERSVMAEAEAAEAADAAADGGAAGGGAVAEGAS